MKLACIIPLYKSKDKQLLQNYRPISLLRMVRVRVIGLTLTLTDLYHSYTMVITTDLYNYRPISLLRMVITTDLYNYRPISLLRMVITTDLFNYRPISLLRMVITTDLYNYRPISLLRMVTTTDLYNYRPISLLRMVSKSVEKCVYTKIYSFFTNHSIFYPIRYGFRSGHSTVYAVTELINRTVTVFENNELSINIHLDLSKAFDTIAHSILVPNYSAVLCTCGIALKRLSINQCEG